MADVPLKYGGIEQLVEAAEKVESPDKNPNLRSYANAFETLLKRAEASCEQGALENAYILLFRVCHMYKQLQQCSGFDKAKARHKDAERALQKSVMKALGELEKLKPTLTERYKEAREKKQGQEKEQQKESKTPEPSLQPQPSTAPAEPVADASDPFELLLPTVPGHNVSDDDHKHTAVTTEDLDRHMKKIESTSKLGLELPSPGDDSAEAPISAPASVSADTTAPLVPTIDMLIPEKVEADPMAALDDFFSGSTGSAATSAAGPEASSTANLITVDELYRRICEDAANILLLDVRDREESRVSKIQPITHAVKSVFIRPEDLREGIGSYEIADKLPANMRRNFDKRHTVETVVLLGSDSTTSTPSTPAIAHLLDAIDKYEGEKRLLNKPLVLQGGYHQWYMCYQSMCSGPPRKLGRRSAASQRPQTSYPTVPTISQNIETPPPSPPPETASSPAASITVPKRAPPRPQVTAAAVAAAQSPGWTEHPAARVSQQPATLQQPAPVLRPTAPDTRFAPQQAPLPRSDLLAGPPAPIAPPVSTPAQTPAAGPQPPPAPPQSPAQMPPQMSPQQTSSLPAARSSGPQPHAQLPSQLATPRTTTTSTTGLAAPLPARDLSLPPAYASIHKDEVVAVSTNGGQFEAASMAPMRAAPPSSASASVPSPQQGAVRGAERPAPSRSQAPGGMAPSSIPAGSPGPAPLQPTPQQPAPQQPTPQQPASMRPSLQTPAAQPRPAASKPQRRPSASTEPGGATASVPAAAPPASPSTPAQAAPARAPSSQAPSPRAPPARAPPPPKRQAPSIPQAAKPFSNPTLHRSGSFDGTLSTMHHNPPPARPAINRAAKPTGPPASSRCSPAMRQQRLISMDPIHGSPGHLQTGMRNLGNTCFMNSVLQCLTNTTPLASYFIQKRYRAELNRRNPLGTKGELAEEFGELELVLWCHNYKHISPTFFLQSLVRFAPQFQGFQQQDCQEFCSFLLDGLHEDLNRVSSKVYMEEPDNDGVPDVQAADRSWQYHLRRNNSIIVDLFQGQFKSTLQCRTCRYTSVTFSPFMFLSLPLPANASRASLDACIRLFTATEHVRGADEWFCSRCKQHREALKTISIWRLPPILLIHLKRFYFDGPFRDKLQTRIDFPVRSFNMRQHVEGPVRQATYELYAVANHYGTLSGGHYTSFCKNVFSKSWFKYDDSVVSPMPESQVCSKEGYLLFYTAINFADTIPDFD